MTKIESRFSELWQAEHEGKQIPIVKKNENEKWRMNGSVRALSMFLAR